MIRVPGYWRNETSGVIVPVVEKYLRGERLVYDEVRTMRAYLHQWINADFYGPGIERLRDDVRVILTTEDVRDWLRNALDAGIDPL